MRAAVVILVVAAGAGLRAAPTAAGPPPIVWQEWSDQTWAQARREHKLVLLDLEAGWCHWCHVMDAVTYRDPGVGALIARNYIAVKVDQDSRPDLASRYEDYGWPATVLYAADGTEILKKQGYITPSGMKQILATVAADPSPERARRVVDFDAGAPAGKSALAPDRRAALRRQWLAGYDEKGGGWGAVHKFVDWDSVELAMREAARGDQDSERRARDTLRLGRKLVDPVWGGVYQYSVGGWDEPHFEKIMAMQGEYLRVYALAYAQWHDPADLAVAQAIVRYLDAFLRAPGGSFYTSQDADVVDGEESAAYFALDDKGRRARGIPRVDQHIYARENGWAITGLASLAQVTDEERLRRQADQAAWQMRAYRITKDSGFTHGAGDSAGPYLGDTLAMGRAFYALYQAAAYAPWLTHAAEAVHFIQAHFARGSAPGFAAADTTRRTRPAPQPEFDENVALARLATAVANAAGDSDARDVADSALRWLLAPGRAEAHGPYIAGLLLAEEEARTDPLHVAVVARHDDPAAAALYRTAVAVPTAHKLIERWDPTEDFAPRGEDIYPSLSQAAAFVCAHGACSAPIFDAAALAARLRKLGY